MAPKITRDTGGGRGALPDLSGRERPERTLGPAEGQREVGCRDRPNGTERRRLRKHVYLSDARCLPSLFIPFFPTLEGERAGLASEAPRGLAEDELFESLRVRKDHAVPRGWDGRGDLHEGPRAGPAARRQRGLEGGRQVLLTGSERGERNKTKQTRPRRSSLAPPPPADDSNSLARGFRRPVATSGSATQREGASSRARRRPPTGTAPPRRGGCLEPSRTSRAATHRVRTRAETIILPPSPPAHRPTD